MKVIFTVSLLLSAAICGFAQTPFYNDIQAFKRQDSIQPPPKNAILFVGSSSFTKWKDVQDYFPGYPIINRGFGGSSLPDVIRYANDIIFPYNARQIVIYCGDNDFAASEAITSDSVFNRFNRLYSLIRDRLPTVDIVYISIKPSPSRRRLMPKEITTNKRISNFIATQPHIRFVDVFSKMLKPDGDPLPEIYLSDSLHMNSKGYAIWKTAITPALIK